jgi:hypothetical protein
MKPMKPIQSAVMRRSITDKQREAEKKYAQEKLRVSPETVSATSSTHTMFGEVGVEENKENKDVDMMAGMKHDVVRIGIIISLCTCDCLANMT